MVTARNRLLASSRQKVRTSEATWQRCHLLALGGHLPHVRLENALAADEQNGSRFRFPEYQQGRFRQLHEHIRSIGGGGPDHPRGLAVSGLEERELSAGLAR
jgi:hypothetical protein